MSKPVKVKSPFLVIREFASQKICDMLVEDVVMEHDTDPDGKPLCAVAELSQHNGMILLEKLTEYRERIEHHFGMKSRGTTPMTITWMPAGATDGQDVRCGNAAYLRKQWIKNKDRDLTCHLFLSVHNDNTRDGFDPDYEVYGGKLQYPQYNFGFQAEAGTLIVHPSGPHFIHAYAPVLAGDLFYVTFHLAAEDIHVYNPEDFPGTPTSWFAGL